MKPVFLIISQVYVPDPAAVGQYVADVAAEMARRGYRTVVYTSRRGYEDPSVAYPAHEVLHGVEVRRLPLSSFGKGSIAIRLVAQFIFLVQALLRALCLPGLCGLMVSTSPPACGIAGAIIGRLRRVPVKYWVMDLNPDQMVAMRVLPAEARAVKLFDAFNRAILRQASQIVVLDRFMAERVVRKAPEAQQKVAVVPPWPLDPRVRHIAHVDNPFRQQQAAADSFVVMYSGNHTPANPLTTLLDAAERLASETRLLVMCIGGGSGKQEVEDRIARGCGNIRSLPYQPLDQLPHSLSAADLHVVAMGDNMVGIVHPCKVYGAMAVSRPLLLLGPAQCHIADLIERYQIGWRVDHGDVEGAQRALREAMAMPLRERQAMGARAAHALAGSLSRSQLLESFCNILQQGLPAPSVRAVPEQRTTAPGP